MWLIDAHPSGCSGGQLRGPLSKDQGPFLINNPDLPKVTRRACLGISPSVPRASLPGTPMGGGRGSKLPAATSTWPLPSGWELMDGEVELQREPARTCCLTPGHKPCLMRPQGNENKELNLTQPRPALAEKGKNMKCPHSVLSFRSPQRALHTHTAFGPRYHLGQGVKKSALCYTVETGVSQKTVAMSQPTLLYGNQCKETWS